MASDARPISFRGVAKSYGEIQALKPLSLEIAAGEFITLLGPSGSGKTTLLNITAGYVIPDRGSIVVGGEDITSLPPRRRGFGMVFQNYALFPHMNVFDNVAYGLRARGVAVPEIEKRVAATLAMVNLEGFSKRRIQQLSGGQQQRVALARAMVIEPAVLLMDEPLGALDRQLRKQVQLEIRSLHRKSGGTTIYVTHDQEEALVMSDRVGIMRGGRVEQIGAPSELYRNPLNVFVAEFLGESNVFKGTVSALAGGEARLNCPELGLEIVGAGAPGLAVGEGAGAIVRPEAITFSDHGGIEAKVVEIVYLGELLAIRGQLKSGAQVWRRCFSVAESCAEGDTVRLAWRKDDVRIVPLTSNPREEA